VSLSSFNLLSILSSSYFVMTGSNTPGGKQQTLFSFFKQPTTPKPSAPKPVSPLPVKPASAPAAPSASTTRKRINYAESDMDEDDDHDDDDADKTPGLPIGKHPMRQ
jgi:hypothetical protein